MTDEQSIRILCILCTYYVYQSPFEIWISCLASNSTQYERTMGSKTLSNKFTIYFWLKLLFFLEMCTLLNRSAFKYGVMEAIRVGVFSVIKCIRWFKMKICDLCLDKWFFNQIQSLSTCQMHAVIQKFETLNLFNLCLIMWHRWALRMSREMTEFDYFRPMALNLHHTVILPDWTLKIWGLSNFTFQSF